MIIFGEWRKVRSVTVQQCNQIIDHSMHICICLYSHEWHFLNCSLITFCLIPTKTAKTCQHRSIFSAGLLLLNFPPPSNFISQNLINLPQYTLSSHTYEDNVSTYIIMNRNIIIVFWFPLGTETSRLRVQMFLLSFGRLQLNFASEHDNFF